MSAADVNKKNITKNERSFKNLKNKINKFLKNLIYILKYLAFKNVFHFSRNKTIRRPSRS
jgi:hypothetical protein